jgi:hypothetical protein
MACPTVRSWCYHLRLNKETTLAPEIPFSEGKDKHLAQLKREKKKKGE